MDNFGLEKEENFLDGLEPMEQNGFKVVVEEVVEPKVCHKRMNGENGAKSNAETVENVFMKNGLEEEMDADVTDLHISNGPTKKAVSAFSSVERETNHVSLETKGMADPPHQPPAPMATVSLHAVDGPEDLLWRLGATALMNPSANEPGQLPIVDVDNNIPAPMTDASLLHSQSHSNNDNGPKLIMSSQKLPPNPNLHVASIDGQEFYVGRPASVMGVQSWDSDVKTKSAQPVSSNGHDAHEPMTALDAEAAAAAVEQSPKMLPPRSTKSTRSRPVVGVPTSKPATPASRIRRPTPANLLLLLVSRDAPNQITVPRYHDIQVSRANKRFKSVPGRGNREEVLDPMRNLTLLNWDFKADKAGTTTTTTTTITTSATTTIATTKTKPSMNSKAESFPPRPDRPLSAPAALEWNAEDRFNPGFRLNPTVADQLGLTSSEARTVDKLLKRARPFGVGAGVGVDSESDSDSDAGRRRGRGRPKKSRLTNNERVRERERDKAFSELDRQHALQKLGLTKAFEIRLANESLEESQLQDTSSRNAKEMEQQQSNSFIPQLWLTPSIPNRCGEVLSAETDQRELEDLSNAKKRKLEGNPDGKLLRLPKRTDFSYYSRKSVSDLDGATKTPSRIIYSIPIDCKDAVVTPKPMPTIPRGFLQPRDMKCKELACLNVAMCRPCQHDQWCLFAGIRRLDYVNGQLTVVGFEVAGRRVDQTPWLPELDGEKFWESNAAKYVLRNLYQRFEDIFNNEKWLVHCLQHNHSPNLNWMPAYRPGEHTRELCDVCYTTIFNLHSFCHHCGLLVCIDCVRQRNRQLKRAEKQNKRRFGAVDKWGWPTCRTTNNPNIPERPHWPAELRLAQLIPDPYPHYLSTLSIMRRDIGEVMDKFQIAAECICSKDETEQRAQERELRCFCENEVRSREGAKEEMPPHTYLCDNQLLLLHQPDHPANIRLFQPHWHQGKTVVVAGVHKRLEPDIWTPQWFKQNLKAENDGGVKVVNCRKGWRDGLVTVSIDEFWNGFVDDNARPTDPADAHAKMYLKLKDYPPNASLKDALPLHYKAFCDALPLPEYSAPEAHPQTGRGRYNLATCLPHDRYVTPDLGPKMYTAYGMINEPKKSSTNLHLDVSDAVNIMLNVTVPDGITPEQRRKAMLDHVRNEGISGDAYKRVEENCMEAGAIWTIFDPQDTDTIRNWLLKKYYAARYLTDLEEELREPFTGGVSDPIHDQCLYLTAELRRKLHSDTGVKGRVFVQMQGDAVFIPAGAAHQVQNLVSCIKVAEDFVSPEGVRHCAAITQEFRDLTREHSNHEDKLQLANIVFHSVRKAVGTLKTELEDMKKAEKMGI